MPEKIITTKAAANLFLTAINNEVAATTHRWYSGRINQFMAWYGYSRPITNITVQTIRAYRDHLVARKIRWPNHKYRPSANSGLSQYTIHGHLRAIKRFFSWLVEEDILPANPSAKITIHRNHGDKPPKAITRRNLRKMIITAANRSSRDLAILLFMADTGCRIGGLASLKLPDLDIDGRSAYVTEKGNKTRQVYFTSQIAYEAMDQWINDRPRCNHEYVFVAKKGKKPLKTTGIRQVIKSIALSAKVRGFANPHSFRHGKARELLREGADLATVSQILGHEGVAVTADFYARWTKSELQERHRQFNWLDKAKD